MQKLIYHIKPHTRRHRIIRLINIAVTGILGSIVGGIIGIVCGYWILAFDLPKLESINDYKPYVLSYVYDRDGNVIGEFKYENQRRVMVTLDQVPKVVVDAVVSSEDAAFWTHKGLDYPGIARAMLVNLKTASFSQGASTITQQVTRSLLLTREKKLRRKLKEMILAVRIEKTFPKKDILTLYLNEIYFGNGAYGIQAAAQNYFDKDVTELTLGEAAMLAGLPQAPSRYSPYWNKEKAKGRQKYVLGEMVDEGYITAEQMNKALKEEWILKKPEDINLKHAPYFVEYVRQYVTKKYGADAINKQGLKIYTTLDTKLQAAADKAVDEGLRELGKRQGWHGVKKHLKAQEVKPFLDRLAAQQKDKILKGEILTGLVIEVQKDSALISVGDKTGKLPVKGARWIEKIVSGKKETFRRVRNLNEILKVNDVIEVKVDNAQGPVFSLEQPPVSEAAMLAMDPHTRYVLAMVGGHNFVETKYNRAIQAKRQPGSSFKPIVYAAALDAGMTPATVIDDTALVFKDGWRPANYDGKFHGKMTMRKALTKSINTVTIRIVDRISTDYVYRYAHRLGISGLAGADLSMALGTYELPPVQLINAYAVFASGGKLTDPIFIKKIETLDGELLEEKVLSGGVEQIAPMANVPDVSDWGTAVDLEQGSFEYATVADPIAKDQFYEDFGLKDEEEEKPDLKKPGKPLTKGQEKVKFKQVISPQTSYLITSILHSVATSGTGARSNALGKVVAGKTGTTNDYVDAWFIGFSPDLLAGVWVGNDAGSKPLGRGEAGSKAALPIWLRFMKNALKDAKNKDFDFPKGITAAKIDPETGLLANPGQSGAYTEYFKAGTEPIQYAPSEDTVDTMDFFEMGLE